MNLFSAISSLLRLIKKDILTKPSPDEPYCEPGKISIFFCSSNFSQNSNDDNFVFLISTKIKKAPSDLLCGILLRVKKSKISFLLC